jgi:hypothetical protein
VGSSGWHGELGEFRERPKTLMPVTECIFQSVIQDVNATVEEIVGGSLLCETLFRIVDKRCCCAGTLCFCASSSQTKTVELLPFRMLSSPDSKCNERLEFRDLSCRKTAHSPIIWDLSDVRHLDTATRTRIVATLVESNRIRSICPMTGAAKGTVTKLLADLCMVCCDVPQCSRP